MLLVEWGTWGLCRAAVVWGALPSFAVSKFLRNFAHVTCRSRADSQTIFLTATPRLPTQSIQSWPRSFSEFPSHQRYPEHRVRESKNNHPYLTWKVHSSKCYTVG